MGQKQPFFSIIIATYARPRQMAARLQSLARLDYPRDRFEAIVVDDVEIEIGILFKQCLDQHIPDEDTLRREITAWEVSRNEQRATMDWRFTTSDARVKLERLYPDIS